VLRYLVADALPLLRTYICFQVNERYLQQLQQVLTFPQTVGIVGGRPSASLYFVGFQQDYIMYLDPHETQEVSHSKGPMTCL
jgi:hypothetical protein